MDDNVILTDEELIQACQYYSAILLIRDWNIKIKIVDRAAIDDSDASVKIDAYYKQATIILPTPESMPACDNRPYNMVECLVHELIHVVLFMVNLKLDHKTLDYVLYEAAVEHLAQMAIQGFPNWRGDDCNKDTIDDVQQLLR